MNLLLGTKFFLFSKYILIEVKPILLIFEYTSNYFSERPFIETKVFFVEYITASILLKYRA